MSDELNRLADRLDRLDGHDGEERDEIEAIMTELRALSARAAVPEGFVLVLQQPAMYQQIHRHINDAKWEECDKATFDQYMAYHARYGGTPPVRVLYAAAPRPAGEDEEAWATRHGFNGWSAPDRRAAFEDAQSWIAPLVQALWERGVITTGSCCGHNHRAGYIGVYLPPRSA